MGRYYSGQISGKCWVAIQNSDDASSFGVNYDNILNFYVCGCSCNFSLEDGCKTNEYCKDCFSSYEEHIQEIIDEKLELDDEDNKITWFISDCEIGYKFEQEHIDMLEEQIQLLEKPVGIYMDTYKIIDDDDEITYDFTIPRHLNRNELALLARLCLGKQILYCLKKHGSCHFWAEI